VPPGRLGISPVAPFRGLLAGAAGTTGITAVAPSGAGVPIIRAWASRSHVDTRRSEEGEGLRPATRRQRTDVAAAAAPGEQHGKAS